MKTTTRNLPIHAVVWLPRVQGLLRGLIVSTLPRPGT